LQDAAEMAPRLRRREPPGLPGRGLEQITEELLELGLGLHLQQARGEIDLLGLVQLVLVLLFVFELVLVLELVLQLASLQLTGFELVLELELELGALLHHPADVVVVHGVLLDLSSASPHSTIRAKPARRGGNSVTPPGRRRATGS